MLVAEADEVLLKANVLLTETMVKAATAAKTNFFIILIFIICYLLS